MLPQSIGYENKNLYAILTNGFTKRRTMKKIILISLLITSAILGCHYKRKELAMATPLPPAPKSIDQFQEIAVQYNEKLPELYNNIAPEERILLYYLHRASLPGNRIMADQMHKDANTIIDLFYTIVSNKDKLLSLRLPTINMPTFVQQAECYFVYVWTNHGQYFEKEFTNNKRTPEYLKLDLLTPQNLTTVLNALAYPQVEKTLATVTPALFDQKHKPTATVPDSIEQSAVNLYAPDFTTQDYQILPVHEQSKLNNYFFISYENGKRIPQAQAYSVSGRCGKELAISCHWLTQAQQHAQQYPQYFDRHLVTSIELLKDFFQTGDEEIFKQHCIEWLKSASRISYCLGFIEVYKDPKGTRGSFQGDATIKSIDLSKLNKILPELEQQLPLPKEFKRTNISTLPNASINCKVFGTGGLGPLRITSAYCLPNYSEIRATHGSKQIIYPTYKTLALLINPQGYRTLFFAKEHAQWLEKNDPECLLIDDLWDVHVILHETIGHGSGKLATHTFKQGDKLTIAGKTYNIGDTIPVTSNNESEFLAGYESTLEELRAEIIALYIMLTNLDQLIAAGFLQKWTQKLTHKELLDWSIHMMLLDGIKRLITQEEHAQEISGDHARADWTIYSYLLEQGCFSAIEQPTTFNNATKTVIGTTKIDAKKTINAVTYLMQEVQRIKSTGDGQAVKKLIDAHCKPLHTPHYIKIIKDNHKTLVGDLKVSTMLSPLFAPIKDKKSGKILDIQATWPKDIFDLATYEHERELSTAE
jgi:hypothetical protein